MSGEGYIAVIAIDFGTTFSGYAFSMRSDKHDIKMNKSWGAEVGFQAYKTPTSILLKPGGDIHSFGFEAQNGFAELDEDEIREGYQLFQRFKMELYAQKKLDSNIMIKSTTGAKKPAIDIIAKALAFMKKHCIDAISKTVATRLSDEYIRWVITVPAIWSDTAKKLMRMAAKKAGLVRDMMSPNLIIALEPEAASVYCRTLANDKFLGMRGVEGKMNMKQGDKYIIVDCGGGTIDITTHEVLHNGKIQEVKEASGGPWGGIYVDRKYYELLDQIFGVDFMNKLKRDHPSTWLSMLVDFETKKRSAKPENATGINMTISHQLAKQFERHSGEDLEDRIKRKKHLGVKFSSGLLRISGDAVRKMYSEVIPKIRAHLSQLLRDTNGSNISKMFVVGGFAESAYLQEFLILEFSRNLQICIPEEAGMSIMKGAVLFGHDTKTITSRIAPVNYCIRYQRNFKPGVDDVSRLFTYSGKQCIYYLQSYVTKGQRIGVNETIEKNCGLYDPSSTSVGLVLYSTEESTENPEHASATKLEEISLTSPNVENKSRSVKVMLRFGDTDILFKGVDLDSGIEVESMVQI